MHRTLSLEWSEPLQHSRQGVFQPPAEGALWFSRSLLNQFLR